MQYSQKPTDDQVRTGLEPSNPESITSIARPWAHPFKIQNLEVMIVKVLLKPIGLVLK